MPELQSIPAAQHCARCQRALRAGTRFCPHCGSSADAVVQIPIGIDLKIPARRDTHFDARWRELRRVGWLFGSLLLNSLLLGLLGRQFTSPWCEVIFSATGVALILGFAASDYRRIAPLLRFRALSRRTLRRLLVVAGAFVVILSGYFALIEWMGVPTLHLTSTLQRAHWPVWSMFALLSLAPAVFEELAFRGVILSSLAKVVRLREAWLIQAALFSVLHLSPLIFVSHFIMGLCFGYLRLKSRSLYPAMMLHGLWNALVVCRELYGS